MQILLNFFQEFMSLGATVLLPFIVAILGIIFKMDTKKAIKSGLLVGFGFQGLVLAVGLLINSINPVMEYYKSIGSGYSVLEIGFAPLGAASWTVPFAVFVIPAIFFINIILVRFRITKVLNIDIWNFMHFLVPGALAYALFGSAFVGFVVSLICGIGVLFFAEWLAPAWQEFFGLEGTTCTTLSFAAWVYPITFILNKIMDKIPGIKNLDVNVSKLGDKLGIFGDTTIIGVLVGVFLSLISKQSFSNTLTVAMGVGASMVLIPRMISVMMEGLTPLSNSASMYMRNKLGEGSELYIGMDIALGLGDPACITVTAIMIPVTILLSFLIPGMRFFPLGILGEVCYLAPMCVLTSKGNLFRSLVTMTIMMAITLVFMNMFIGEATQMLSVTGVAVTGEVTASHFGWNPGNLIVNIIYHLFAK